MTRSSSSSIVLVVAGMVAAAACGGAQPTAPPAEQPASAAPSEHPAGDPGAALTAARCKAAGGEVVGDIGDGAIHRPGYRCPRSGQPPLGPVAPDPDGPVAIEGSVCCR